jgi:DNA repair and recombination protein RAD52
MFSENQIKELSKNIDSSRVKIRDKSGIKLQYLETYDVINEANRIFNYMWNYTITRLSEVDRSTNQNGNHVITFSAIVKVKIFDDNGNFVEREDTGVGIGTARTIGDAIDNASKSSVSDSLKRCLRTMGSAYGNNLYSKTPNPQQSNQQQNYSKTPNNTNQQNYSQNSNTQVNQQSYQHQQDFQQLTNLGLQIIEKGDMLIVQGDKSTIISNKELLKTMGFRFDFNGTKEWYILLRQAA